MSILGIANASDEQDVGNNANKATTNINTNATTTTGGANNQQAAARSVSTGTAATEDTSVAGAAAGTIIWDHTNSNTNASTAAAPSAIMLFALESIDIPLNDLSDGSDDDDDGLNINNTNNNNANDELEVNDLLGATSNHNAGDEAAGLGLGASAGSLSLGTADDDGEEEEAASATTTGSPQRAVGSRRPSFQREGRRLSQRRRSSATSFEMHDSLVFEELNKLVEDDTDDDDEEDDAGDDDNDDENEGENEVRAEEKTRATASTTDSDTCADTASQDTAPGDDAEAPPNERRGRRGSSRSLASVLEDMALDDVDEDEDDVSNKNGNSNSNPNTNMSSKKHVPITMRFEQQILDRLGRQEGTRGLVRTRSEAALNLGSRSGAGGGTSRRNLVVTGRASQGSLRRLDAPSSSSSALGVRRNHPGGPGRAQSERVLAPKANEVWPVIDVGGGGGGGGANASPSALTVDAEEAVKEARTSVASVKSFLRGLGRKK